MACEAQRPGRGAGISGSRAQSILRLVGRGRRRRYRGVHVLWIARVRRASVGPARPALDGEPGSRATPRSAQSARQHAALRHHDRGAGNLGAALSRASRRCRCPSRLRAVCRIQLLRPRAPLAARRLRERRTGLPPVECVRVQAPDWLQHLRTTGSVRQRAGDMRKPGTQAFVPRGPGRPASEPAPRAHRSAAGRSRTRTRSPAS
jgi:hypothetical protein